MATAAATANGRTQAADLSRDELLTLWESQLTGDERQAMSRLRNQSTQKSIRRETVSVAEAVQWAEEHLFDRNSVVLECQSVARGAGRARRKLRCLNSPISPAAWLYPDEASRRSDFTRRFAARMGNRPNREGRRR